MHASPLRFKSVRLEGSTIFLDGFQINGLERLLKPFPACWDGLRNLAEAVIISIGYMEAIVYLYSFAEELLAGKPTLLPIFSSELDTDLLI